MSIETSIIATPAEFAGLEPLWQRWSAGRAPGILSPGVSSSYEWHQCLLDNHLEQGHMHVLLYTEDGEPVAVFPGCLQESRSGPLRFHVLQHLQQLYATRSGFLVDFERNDAIAHVLQALHASRVCSRILLTVIEQSHGDAALRRCAAEIRLGIMAVQRDESVYIDLSADGLGGDDYFDGLERKFRYNVSSRETKLAREGELDLKIVRAGSEVREFLDGVYEIERNSWKEAAGTSVTQNRLQQGFYELFTPLAARREWLRGAMLTLDGEPIAYSYGIAYNGVFESLKSSFKERYKKFGPGNVIKKRLLRFVVEEGLLHYDLMGEIESSKLKWQPRNYARVTYCLFPGSMAGRASRVMARVRVALGRPGG